MAERLAGRTPHAPGLIARVCRSGYPVRDRGAHGHSGKASQQFRCTGKSHRKILNAAIRVVAELSGLEQLADETLQIRADATQVVIAQFTTG